MEPELTELLSGMVGIDSVNPSLEPSGTGERKVIAFVEGWALAAGSRSRFSRGRPAGRARSCAAAVAAADGRCCYAVTSTPSGSRT